MTSGLLDLASAKMQVDVKTAVDDTEMVIFVDAAVGMVENIVGPVDARPAQTRTLIPFSSAAMYQGVTASLAGPWLLDLFPVLTLDTLTSAGASLDVGLLQVQKHSGIVTSQQPLLGPAVLTFTAGRISAADATAGVKPPAVMQLATRIIFAHLWATQRGSSGRSRFQQGSEDNLVVGMGFAIPNRAADLLRPYQLPPSVA